MHSCEAHVSADSRYYNYSPSTTAREHFLYPICVGDFVYEAGYDLRRTTYDSYLLEMILDGHVTIETGGRTLTAHQGQAVLIDCHRPHRYYSQTGWHARWVHFDGAAAKGYFALFTRRWGGEFPPCTPPVSEALHALFHMFDVSAALSEVQMALLLTQALSAMAEPPLRHGTSPLLENVTAQINCALGSDLSIADLARGVGLSEYHFIRVFREQLGMTPRQYIISARMAQARYLLRTTGLPISDIAEQVGYHSASMFSATFKRLHGRSPGSYRAEPDADASTPAR